MGKVHVDVLVQPNIAPGVAYEDTTAVVDDNAEKTCQELIGRPVLIEHSDGIKYPTGVFGTVVDAHVGTHVKGADGVLVDSGKFQRVLATLEFDVDTPEGKYAVDLIARGVMKEVSMSSNLLQVGKTLRRVGSSPTEISIVEKGDVPRSKIIRMSTAASAGAGGDAEPEQILLDASVSKDGLVCSIGALDAAIALLQERKRAAAVAATPVSETVPHAQTVAPPASERVEVMADIAKDDSDVRAQLDKMKADAVAAAAELAAARAEIEAARVETQRLKSEQKLAAVSSEVKPVLKKTIDALTNNLKDLAPDSAGRQTLSKTCAELQAYEADPSKLVDDAERARVLEKCVLMDSLTMASAARSAMAQSDMERKMKEAKEAYEAANRRERDPAVDQRAAQIDAGAASAWKAATDPVKAPEGKLTDDPALLMHLFSCANTGHPVKHDVLLAKKRERPNEWLDQIVGLDDLVAAQTCASARYRKSY